MPRCLEQHFLFAVIDTTGLFVKDNGSHGRALKVFGTMGGRFKLKPGLGLGIAIEMEGDHSFRADRLNLMDRIGHKTDDFTGRQDFSPTGSIR